jgi:hypothetical protein
MGMHTIGIFEKVSVELWESEKLRLKVLGRRIYKTGNIEHSGLIYNLGIFQLPLHQLRMGGDREFNLEGVREWGRDGVKEGLRAGVKEGAMEDLRKGFRKGSGNGVRDAGGEGGKASGTRMGKG